MRRFEKQFDTNIVRIPTEKKKLTEQRNNVGSHIHTQHTHIILIGRFVILYIGHICGKINELFDDIIKSRSVSFFLLEMSMCMIVIICKQQNCVCVTPFLFPFFVLYSFFYYYYHYMEVTKEPTMIYQINYNYFSALELLFYSSAYTCALVHISLLS